MNERSKINFTMIVPVFLCNFDGPEVVLIRCLRPKIGLE